MRFDVIDIAGIKEATVERIIEVEKEANERIERMQYRTSLTNEDVENHKWYENVAFRCDYELKERGAREKEEWEAMFS